MNPRVVLALGLLAWGGPLASSAQIQRWRVGDERHPWNLVPVTGRLSWGRGWACEILVDDDGDGLLDEDGVELVDADGDGLINEDPEDLQVDNDGDGQVNEDPIDNRDNDGDGSLDEDPPEVFDNDLDGRIDEDGPDPQVDNDGDGRLNEDGRFSDLDDDYDGRQNEDPVNHRDEDGDGLIDEDPPLPRGGSMTTWLRPIRLDSLRNLATEVNYRYLLGEFGGVIPGKSPSDPFMVVPSEYGPRTEGADPISGNHFQTAVSYAVARVDYVKMVDGDLSTAFGGTAVNWAPGLSRASQSAHTGGVSINLMGYYYIDRVIFRPRPSLPAAAIANYVVLYGDPTTVNVADQRLVPDKVLIPITYGQANPATKDLRVDSPVLMGRLDIVSLDPEGVRVEIAETGIYGEGFPLDASYTSEIIDLGTDPPRVRRSNRQLELFSSTEQDLARAEFPERPGKTVNWGKVRWRGRREGKGGDIRLQFRAGNSLDTHVYARQTGPGQIDTRGEDGQPLDLFAWLGLKGGQVPEKDLPYNELGVEIGVDGTKGWSFWSAPFKFEDGLIDESLPPERWDEVGVPLPLPGGMRYVQFRLFFDSTQESACLLDFVEFEYGVPLVGEGIVAEIFPVRVPLGEEVQFHYYLRPQFAVGEKTRFNRIEIEVPSVDTRVDTFKFDYQPWEELPVSMTDASDPLRAVIPRRLNSRTGQFAQAVVVEAQTGEPKLLLKLPPMSAEDFRYGELIEIAFTSKLFRGSKQFAAAVWNDQEAASEAVLPQPVEGGDATSEVATDAVLVVVDQIKGTCLVPRVAPNPFTPNGDGVNDEVEFAVDLFLALEPVEVAVEICDLAGRLVHTLGPERRSAGQVRWRWDGLDERGELLPPGIYLYRVRSAVGEAVGLLSLVY